MLYLLSSCYKKLFPLTSQSLTWQTVFLYEYFFYELVSDRLSGHYNIISNDLEHIKMSFRYNQANM